MVTIRCLPRPAAEKTVSPWPHCVRCQQERIVIVNSRDQTRYQIHSIKFTYPPIHATAMNKVLFLLTYEVLTQAFTLL
jgi:hypothetical protein